VLALPIEDLCVVAVEIVSERSEGATIVEATDVTRDVTLPWPPDATEVVRAGKLLWLTVLVLPSGPTGELKEFAGDSERW
jgi:hypothetical protein